jgi:hypothetical protein
VLRSLLEFLLVAPLRGEMPMPVLGREAQLLRQAHLGPEAHRKLEGIVTSTPL